MEFKVGQKIEWCPLPFQYPPVWYEAKVLAVYKKTLKIKRPYRKAIVVLKSSVEVKASELYKDRYGSEVPSLVEAQSMLPAELKLKPIFVK